MDDFERELIESSAQRSEVWRDARCGKFTASEIWKLMGEPRSKAAREAGGWTDTAMTYIESKVCEELTGFVHESSPAYPLVWGEEQEPNAKALFEELQKVKIQHAGFIPFTDHAGGSPDGFIYDNAIAEVKCPFVPTNQIKYLRIRYWEDLLEGWPEYFWQCQANMLFTKRQECYFITYDPRFRSDRHRLFWFVMRALPEYQNQILFKLELAIKEKIKILELLK